MRNKFVNILMFFLIVFMIILVLQYVGLGISDKYETQLEGMHPNIVELKEAKILKEKIECQKKIIPFLFLFSLTGLFILFIKKKKDS